jgi:opacity protein-like surface antigen
MKKFIIIALCLALLTGWAFAAPNQKDVQPVSGVQTPPPEPIQSQGAFSSGPPDVKTASAYANYEFDYAPGVQCEYCMWQRDGGGTFSSTNTLSSYSSPYWYNQLFLAVNAGKIDAYAWCPLQSVISRNTIHPKVGTYHFSISGTNNDLDLDFVTVYNGQTPVYTADASGLNVAGYNEYYMYTPYFDMVRGITLYFNIDNFGAGQRTFLIHGYGAKQEW